MAADAQAGVQVNPGDSLGLACVLAQHGSQGEVAPRWLNAAVKQAVGKLVLTLADGRLISRFTVFCNEVYGGCLIRRIGRPLLRQDQWVQGTVGRVVWQWFGEILEVAVQVHVFVGSPADVRKAVRVQRMDVQNCCAPRRICPGFFKPFAASISAAALKWR